MTIRVFWKLPFTSCLGMFLTWILLYHFYRVITSCGTRNSLYRDKKKKGINFAGGCNARQWLNWARGLLTAFCSVTACCTCPLEQFCVVSPALLKKGWHMAVGSMRSALCRTVVMFLSKMWQWYMHRRKQSIPCRVCSKEAGRQEELLILHLAYFASFLNDYF